MSYGLWLALGGILVVAEAFAPGFVLIWFGIAALVTGAMVFFMPEISWQFQAVAFAVLSLGSLVAWFMFKPKLEASSDRPNLNQRGEASVGRSVVLETAIANGRGSARLGDGVWSVRGPDTPAGTSMIVTGVEGAVLIVGPAEDNTGSKSDNDTGQR